MDRFLEYQGFSEVAETGSFTRAAESLGLTASAVSKQVRALEERLGARLLNRTTRRVSLTEAGRAFHERVRSVLDDAAEAEQGVVQLQTELRGTLRVGAPMDFGRAHLAGALAAFAGRNPELELHVEFADRFVDLIEEGFDVLIRIGELADSSLVARRLAPCRRVICASPEYLQAYGAPSAPSELVDHHRVAYAYESERSWAFFDRSSRSEDASFRVTVPTRHRSNNGQLTRALVLQGAGIALLPTFLVADDLRAGRLVALLVSDFDGEIPIHAIYPHRKHLSAKVRRFVDDLVEHCGPLPYWDEGLELGRQTARRSGVRPASKSSGA